jgi:PAS domain S-box-containing protein
MKRDILAQQVETMEQRLQALQRRAGALIEQPTPLAEAVEDLSAAMSELSLAAEELRQRNDDLELRASARAAELVESNQALRNEIAERKRIEQALQESQENLRAMFDLSGVGQAQVDAASGRFIHVNRKLCEMTGYAASELLGMTFTQLTHPEDREADLARYQQVLRGEINDWFGEKRYVRKEGEIIWVQVNGTLIRDGAGHPLYSVAVIADITGCKRAEEALQQSEARLRSVLENSLDAAYRRNLQTDRYDYMSQVFERITGWSVEEMNRMDIADVLALIHPDDLPGVQQEIERTLAACQADQVTGALEYRFKGKDGKYCWLGDHITVLAGDDGRPLYRLGIVRDIAERKEREKELYRLNRTLKARSHSDLASMHATNEAEYMQQVCKIIVKDCGHAMVWIGFAEEDEAKSVRPVAHAGFEEGYLETLHITWADTERGRGPTGTAIRTGEPSFCRNMLTDPKFTPWRAEALKRGYASSLVLPLLDQGRAFGALNIYFREPDPFTEDEVTLLSGLADDLAYGIKMLRLRAAHEQAEAALRESEERARDQAARLQAVLDAAPAIIWVAHDHECRSITGNRAAQALLRVPEGTNVSKSGPAPELLAHYRVFSDGVELAPQDMPIQRAAASGQAFRDYAMDIVFADGSVRSLLGNVTPVLDSAGQSNGAIAAFVDITERQQAEQERAQREQLRLLARQVVSVQEQERRRVSRELHDEAGQALTALKISLELMLADLPDDAASLRERIYESVMLTDDTMERIRLLARDLRPPALDAVGLGPTLEDVCRDFGERTQLSIDYASGELPALPDAVSICLYRVLQEALTNVAKHAHARRVRVALHRDVDSVSLTVEDDGQGFDSRAILSSTNRPPGIGLLGMQDRIELLGGWLEIDSHPGQGTRLVTHIPWENGQ